MRLDEGDLGGGNYFGSHGSLLHTAERATEPSPLPASEPAVATKATVQAAYGNLPLSFEANEGQSDAQVQFLARGHGYSLFLTSTEAVLALPNAEWGMRNAEFKSLSRSNFLTSGHCRSSDDLYATIAMR